MTGSHHGDIARRWWHGLVKDPARRGAARASLARLRRAGARTDAFLEPATSDLVRRLGVTSPKQVDRAAAIAMVLAHVREDDATPVARACGPADDSDSGKLKYNRFRRLLQAEDDELVDQMRRLVHLLGGRVNVADLATSLLFWGDGTRRRWALAYYRADREPESAAASAARPSTSEDPSREGTEGHG